MTVEPTETIVHNYALEAARVMAEFARKRFNLGEDWVPYVRPDFNPRRRRSWGGVRCVGGVRSPVGAVPFMSLALARYLGNGAATDLQEYKSFAADPVIGTFEGRCWEAAVNCLVAHELAHAIQYTLRNPEVVQELGGFNKGHKSFWKNIYAILRQEYVNDRGPLVVCILYGGPRRVTAQPGAYNFGEPILPK